MSYKIDAELLRFQRKEENLISCKIHIVLNNKYRPVSKKESYCY